MRLIKWYMITTITGKELSVIDSLWKRIKSESMESEFEDIQIMLVPKLSPRELEKKNAGLEYKTREANLFPGYIFIKMNMTNEAWFMVRNTLYVTGLVGSSGHRTKPTPVSNLEMRKMQKKVESIRTDFDAGRIQTQFRADKIVEVIDGPSKGMVGKILEASDDKQIAIIELILFERKTPTELKYSDLKIRK